HPNCSVDGAVRGGEELDRLFTGLAVGEGDRLEAVLYGPAPDTLGDADGGGGNRLAMGIRRGIRDAELGVDGTAHAVRPLCVVGTQVIRLCGHRRHRYVVGDPLYGHALSGRIAIDPPRGAGVG